MDVEIFDFVNVQFSYCIGKIDFFLYISVFITIFPYTTRLGFLGPSEQSEDMYFAVAPKTSPAKCLSYCIGKIDFFFEISVFLMIFPYTTRLGFLRQCIFAKRNAHVCAESFAFASACLSYRVYYGYRIMVLNMQLFKILIKCIF